MSIQTDRYPKQNEWVAAYVFPRVQQLIQHLTEDDAFQLYTADGTPMRAPILTSQQLPPALQFRWKFGTGRRMKADLPGTVEIRIDLAKGSNDAETYDKLYQNAQMFRDQGFTPDKLTTSKRKNHGLVYESWTKSDDDFADEAFLQEVADRYIELVEICHEVFNPSRSV